MLDPQRQEFVGKLMLYGLISMGVGAVLLLVGFVGGQVPILLVGGALDVFGFIAVAWSLTSGHAKLREDRTAAKKSAENVQVMARFGINHLGEMLFTIEDVDIPDLRYYVRILFPDGRQGEFETAFPLFCQCGEGMWGDITFEGDWLSSFTPRTAPPKKAVL
jgi:hypothetical protein